MTKIAGPRRIGRSFLFRLPAGSDILDGLTRFCAEKKVRCGWIQALGATSVACFGYYDQRRHRYFRRTFRRELEILSCVGNVSLKEGKPFLHLHATLGDTRLRAWGGHLFAGSRVFAAEALVVELRGPRLRREPDAATGLALWPLEGCAGFQEDRCF